MLTEKVIKRTFTLYRTATLLLVVTLSLVSCGRGESPIVINNLPSLVIISPSDGTSSPLGDSISFMGNGTDSDGLNLTDTSLVWSSDIDGMLGTGTSLNVSSLTGGGHTITLTATDSESRSSSASIDIHISWSARYGDTNIELLYSGMQTADGGYVLVGSNLVAGSGSSYIVKTDSSGSEEWSNSYNGGSNVRGRSIKQTSDDGYIIAGSTFSDISFSDSDVYILKIDSSGAEEWSNTYGGRGSQHAFSIEKALDGGHIIGGTNYETTDGGSDVYILKIDSVGVEEWTYSGGTVDNDYGESVRQTTDGGYIIVGLSAPSPFSPELGDMFVVKVSSTGVKEWSAAYGGTGSEYGYDILETSDGGYLVGGYTIPIGRSDSDMYLSKTDSTGGVLWSKTYGGTGSEGIYSLDYTSDGGYILCGNTLSYGAGGNDIFLVEVDLEGTELWSEAHGTIGDEVCAFVEETSDGGYIVGGEMHPDGFTGGENPDYYLVKVGEGGR